MSYDLTQCHNTGNWWIWMQEENGHRSIIKTLSADLTYTQAKQYMSQILEAQETKPVDSTPYEHNRGR